MCLENIEKYYVDDGCHSELSNTKDDVIGAFLPKSSEAGIRCCTTDGKDCETPDDCPFNNVMYDNAASQCAERGQRLCTKSELLSEICCKSGGNCDDYAVWTSTKEPGRTLLFPFKIILIHGKICFHFI